jgi:hypothetical protein
MPVPLPTAGPISFSEIAAYLGFGGTDNSLRFMSSEAGFSTPDSVSEFYGYSGSGLIAVSWGYASRNIYSACIAMPTTFYADSSSPNTATAVYADAEGNIPGFIGFYSDGISSREFDGNSFVGFGYMC